MIRTKEFVRKQYAVCIGKIITPIGVVIALVGIGLVFGSVGNQDYEYISKIAVHSTEYYLITDFIYLVMFILGVVVAGLSAFLKTDSERWLAGYTAQHAYD